MNSNFTIKFNTSKNFFVVGNGNAPLSLPWKGNVLTSTPTDHNFGSSPFFCWRGWIWTNEATLVTDYLQIVPICPHQSNANVQLFLLWYSSCIVAGEGFEPSTSRLWALLATSATPHDIYNANIQIIFEITKFFIEFFWVSSENMTRKNINIYILY